MWDGPLRRSPQVSHLGNSLSISQDLLWAENRKQRRQQHGSAWHWKQTDCWYYTLPGTKKRMPLLDKHGQRIRGKANQEAAETALAKVKLAQAADPANAVPDAPWLVARVCSEYLQYCARGVANHTISKGHHTNALAWLNDLCGFCGGQDVSEVKKGHIQTWLANHPTWQSSATQRSVIAVVLAAFNYAQAQFDIPNPLKGLKKPASKPRLQSFSREDEQALYVATEEQFGNFLFAAIHTGLRPFCELARITADDVEENGRGMMWRVYSSKTKKTRKIPVQNELADLARKLMKTAPRGSGVPLLRNTKGRPWKPPAGVVRFIAIKKKLGWDQDPTKTKYSCYNVPAHLCASDALGLLEQWRGVFHRDPGRTDRRYAQGGLRSLREGVGAALPGTAVGGGGPEECGLGVGTSEFDRDARERCSGDGWAAGDRGTRAYSHEVFESLDLLSLDLDLPLASGPRSGDSR